jgi:SHS2 domain-containing protein
MIRIVSHTADIGIEIKADSLNELFSEAARGWRKVVAGNIICRGKNRRKIDLTGITAEELLVQWLSELNFYFETEYELFCETEYLNIAREDDGVRLLAEYTSSRVDPEHAAETTELKAVTYHQLRIEEDKSGKWFCTVYFDL